MGRTADGQGGKLPALLALCALPVAHGTVAGLRVVSRR